MPTKLNSAGEQQNYVPAGNGDASGEYGDNATGSNKHFKSFSKENDKPKVVKGKAYFKKNYFDDEVPLTAYEIERYKKALSENRDYYEKVFEKEINTFNDEDFEKVKDEVIKNYEKDIDNANIDNIKDFIYTGGTGGYNQIEKVLSGYTDLTKKDIDTIITSKRGEIFDRETEKKLSEKAKQKGFELADKYIKDNFKKIKGEHSIEDDLKAVNPRYSENRYYQINCQRCPFVYELRRRGFDVEANPNKNDFGYGVWRTQMEFKDTESFKNNIGSVKLIKEIKQHILDAGEGSRFAIDVQWSRSTNGHLFLAENINGEVKFFDPQNPNQNAESYFSYVAVTKYTDIYRLDNGTFNYGVKETGFTPKGE